MRNQNEIINSDECADDGGFFFFFFFIEDGQSATKKKHREVVGARKTSGAHVIVLTLNTSSLTIQSPPFGYSESTMLRSYPVTTGGF
jgi:hypothetical protein